MCDHPGRPMLTVPGAHWRCPLCDTELVAVEDVKDGFGLFFRWEPERLR